MSSSIFKINKDNWGHRLVSSIKKYEMKFSLNFIVNEAKQQIDFIIYYEEDGITDKVFKGIFINKKHTSYCDIIEDTLYGVVSDIVNKFLSPEAKELLVNMLYKKFEKIMEDQDIKFIL